MKKEVTIVFAANIVNMIFSVITSFILPKYLSIESYGYYKIFQLYINYLGIAHLGFVDGIYLRYGGKNIREIDSDEILSSSATIRNMQILFTLIVVVSSIAFKNQIVVLLALSCVPVNMVSFYKNLFQATGEFKDYSIMLIFLPILMFVFNITLLFVFKTDNYIAYILVVFFSNFLLYVLLEYKNRKMFGKIRFIAFDCQLLKDNITAGITLTIGNFASIMITSIDRWCIQAWMEISDFSYYSFAVSVENLFNVYVSAVTTTLYNYLCRVKEIQKIIRLKSYCIFIGIYLVSVAFPVKFIIQHWLVRYDASINSLFLLICAHSFYFVIKAIYVNLYKARGQQKYYLHQILIVLLIAIMTNMVTYFLISRTKEAFAYASLLTSIAWFFICYREFKDIRGRIQEIILLLVSSVIYLMCGLLLDNAILGFAIYVIIITLFSMILCITSFREFIEMCFGYIGQIVLQRKVK